MGLVSSVGGFLGNWFESRPSVKGEKEDIMSTVLVTPLPSLSDATTAAENAGTAYVNAGTQTASDQVKAAALQATITSDLSVQTGLLQTYVTSLQTLDAVVQALLAGLPQSPAPITTDLVKQ